MKKIWCAISKIEKYSELAAEGLGKAIKYLVLLIIMLSVVSSGVVIYITNKQVKSIAKYIDGDFPEFTYSNETLNVDSQEPIIKENEEFGKIIVDTNVETEEDVNQYLNDVQEESAVIILKNKLILKEEGLQGTINYNYKELFEKMDIADFNKESLVEYLTSSKIMPLYLNLFLISFIYAFLSGIINVLFYIIILSIVGYMATWFLKMKIRYVAIFNMAIYSMTLPTLLYMIYIIINGIFSYTINYFEVMYTAIASIYMVAAIFLLKSDFNKKKEEVQKVIEVEKEVKKEMEEKEQKENKREKKKEEQEDSQDDEEGSNETVNE